METGILHLHNLLRWLVLICGIWAIIKAYSGMKGHRAFTASDKRPPLLFLIFCDIQLLVGLFLYFKKGWANVLSSGGNVMSNAAQRFFAVEHLLGMVVAIVLVHIGYSVIKKNVSDERKFKNLFWFFTIALLIMLLTIPWPFRDMVARPL